MEWTSRTPRVNKFQVPTSTHTTAFLEAENRNRPNQQWMRCTVWVHHVFPMFFTFKSLKPLTKTVFGRKQNCYQMIYPTVALVPCLRRSTIITPNNNQFPTIAGRGAIVLGIQIAIQTKGDTSVSKHVSVGDACMGLISGTNLHGVDWRGLCDMSTPAELADLGWGVWRPAWGQNRTVGRVRDIIAAIHRTENSGGQFCVRGRASSGWDACHDRGSSISEIKTSPKHGLGG